ncbi:MAG: alpha-L-fucosidase [Planctomycetia bacterium]|nr:alpha-L-fucosidase [Planctomycetia bacterium]
MRIIVLFGCAAALSAAVGGAVGGAVVGVVLAAEASDEKGPKGWETILVPADPIMVNSVPSPRQLIYQTNQYGAFLHYGPAVFLDGDWKSTPDPKIFNPTQLDVEQWVRVAKSFDAKHIVFSAKHHNGFCLWPTGTTDYSVRGSPWRDGRGDVIGELATACRKHGIGLGLYYSGQDRRFPCHTDDPSADNRAAYWPVYKRQLDELMSNYGDLVCLWLDSYLSPFDWRAVDPATGKPYGDEIVAMARAKQPKMVIWGGTQPDLTSCSHPEDGMAPYPLWNVMRQGQMHPGFGPPSTEGWIIPEAYNCHGTFAWVPSTPRQLMEQYYASVGRGANFLQALVPDKRGLIDDAQAKAVAEFGAEVRRRFQSPLARTDSSRGWLEPGVLQLDLGGAKKIAHVVLEEEIAKGQHVLKYGVDVFAAGTWKTVAEGQSIGRKRIERFEPPITAEKVRFRVVQANAIPNVITMTVHGPNGG